VRLIPRDDRFFDLFAEMAGILVQSANTLQQLFADPSRLDEFQTNIKNLEHQADRLTAEANRKVDTTFVTRQRGGPDRRLRASCPDLPHH
jgi:uncharacterized protein